MLIRFHNDEHIKILCLRQKGHSAHVILIHIGLPFGKTWQWEKMISLRVHLQSKNFLEAYPGVIRVKEGLVLVMSRSTVSIHVIFFQMA